MCNLEQRGVDIALLQRVEGVAFGYVVPCDTSQLQTREASLGLSRYHDPQRLGYGWQASAVQNLFSFHCPAHKLAEFQIQGNMVIREDRGRVAGNRGGLALSRRMPLRRTDVRGSNMKLRGVAALSTAPITSAP